MRTQFWLIFLAPAVITVGWVAAIWKGAPILVLVMGFILAALAWHSYMTIPYQFAYEAGESICFQSVIRSVCVAFQDIRSVDVRKWNRGFVTIRHMGGSINLLRNMPGLKDLVEEIQRFNLSAVVKGRI